MGKPNTPKSVTSPRGFRAAGTTCGLKPSGAPDLAIIAADAPSTVAGMLTTNSCCGEPVKIIRRHIRGGIVRAIVCNSGNANVATGRQGRHDALAMAHQVADYLGCPLAHVLPCSTGVIGQPLPMEKIDRGIATAISKLARGPAADADAARAILTTDLVPKPAHRRVRLGQKTATIGGIAKGSGMVAPNMATMLAFITTDAAISTPMLRRTLRQAVGQSFNRISIDEDTSTSDAVVIMASGAAGNRRIDRQGAALNAFSKSLTGLCRDLAYQLVSDGEGATKVFRVMVKRARSARNADQIGKAIVGSPLVKTMVYGCNPNWGRLIMAIGKSGAAVIPEKLTITIGDVAVCKKGEASRLTKTAAARLKRHMRRKQVHFLIDLSAGKSEAEWLGCDLSRQYIAINADYTT